MNTDRFKFRLWDEEKKMYVKEMPFVAWDDKNYFDIICKENLIVEHCTGLRDKNGVLIYEGDIVNLYPAENADHLNRLVVWLHDGWATMKDYDSSSWGFGVHQVEIIGNIHGAKE